MTLLKIARMGHPVLMNKAQAIENPTDPQVKRWVKDMVETMTDAPGVGLAAPQVHLPYRLVVYRVPAERMGPGGRAVPLTVLINPEIEAVGDETEVAVEGCLSLPGMSGQVRRAFHIRYRYHDLEGKSHEKEATGFHARVIQHECDHLDGILYPMRMDDLSSFGYVEETQRALRTGEA